MANRQFDFISFSVISVTLWLECLFSSFAERSVTMNYHLSTFGADVTPPLDHPLCGGWIEPVRGVDDPLKALGVVLLGAGKPIVMCAVDWCGIRNDAHLAWRTALAEAANTTIDHVAVQSVHPHNAPFTDLVAQKLLDQYKGPASDLKFHEQAIAGVAKAHEGIVEGSGSVYACGNRFEQGVGGCFQSADHRQGWQEQIYASPVPPRMKRFERNREGLIDPMLRVLSFWNGPKPLAAFHYYATHPMSYYGDGRVSADFCGLRTRSGRG